MIQATTSWGMTLHRTCSAALETGEEKERTVEGAVLSLFIQLQKDYRGKKTDGQQADKNVT